MTDATLLLRLRGPLQAYGVRSRYELRDTDPHPSKSAVLGMLCAALGRDRAEDIGDLAGLRFAVRSDDEGRLLRDFQTVGIDGWISASGTVKRGEPKLSTKYYLADATFATALSGSATILSTCAAALRAPVWPVFLGRRCCVPSAPLLITVAEVDDPITALERLPYQGWRAHPPPSARLVAEDPAGPDILEDQPVSFGLKRAYAPRAVSIRLIALPRRPFALEDGQAQ